MPKLDYFTKGQLTDLAYLVLAALTKPRHGYLIMQQIDHISGGEVTIGPASLYTTLKKLTEAGFIRLLASSDNRKTYHITPDGLAALNIEIDKRKRLAAYGETAIAEFEEIKDE